MLVLCHLTLVLSNATICGNWMYYYSAMYADGLDLKYSPTHPNTNPVDLYYAS